MSVNLGDINFGLGADTTRLERARRGVEMFGRTFETAAQRQARSAKAAQDATARMNTTLQRLGNISVLVNGPLGSVAGRLNTIARVAETVNLSTAAAIVGVAGATVAFFKMGQSAVTAAKAFERAEKALDSLNELETLTGVQMDYLADLTERVGGNFSELAGQFARVQAASQGTNLEGQRTLEIFEGITLAGAKMSLTSDEIAGALKAVEQIMSKGQLQAEELRGQLGDRIPGAVQIMARALGITTAELSKLMKQGKITSDALVPFVQELTKTYGVELGDAIDTIVAKEGRLRFAYMRTSLALDETIGFSRAYSRTLDTFTGILNTITDNMDTVAKVTLTVGAGFLGLFAPSIIGGLWTLVGVLRAATVAMLGLNAATLANPLGALANVLVRVTLAVGAAVGAWQLLDQLIGDNATSATEDLTAGIQQNEVALKNAASASAAFRAELATQIEMQKMAAEAAYDEASAQAFAAAAKVRDMQAAHTGGLFDIFSGGKSWALQDAEAEAAAREDTARLLRDQLMNLEDQLDIIEAMRSKLGEGSGPLDPLGGAGTGSESAASRVAKAIREATQSIHELDAAWEAAQLPEGQQEWARIQTSINKQIQDYKDKLVDAKVPAETIVALTRQYGEALRTLEEGTYILEHSVTVWEMIGDVVGTGVDNAFASIIDSIVEGKDVLLELKDVGKAVAVDLLKTFTQLAVANPLKNLLFGQSNQTLSGWGSGGGIGSFFSGLFGNLFGGSSLGNDIGKGISGSFVNGALKFANGGAGSGGILKQPTFFSGRSGAAWGGELDDEAVLPLGRTSSGQLGVMSAGGGGGGGGPNEVNFNFYLSANGDDAIMDIVEQGVSQALALYDSSNVQRTAQANVKARFRRLSGARN